MFYNGGWFMGGMHFLWWIFWIGVVGALAWAVWGRPRDPRESGPDSRETPHEILLRKLASGECTPEDYEQRKAMLDRDSPGKH